VSFSRSTKKIKVVWLIAYLFIPITVCVCVCKWCTYPQVIFRTPSQHLRYNFSKIFLSSFCPLMHKPCQLLIIFQIHLDFFGI
jgi:hypothetical protein